MKKESPLVEKIIQLIYQHINCYSIHECDSILEGLHYIFNRSIGRPINNLSKINLKDFQISLSKINEKGTQRKSNGVYYTPKDVTEYIVANSYLNFECPQNSRVYSAEKCINLILKSNIKNILRSKVYDPTCGTAEFLISAFEIKLFLIKKTGTLFDEDILGEFYQFNLSSCIRQQNSLTAQFVSFSLANLANIFYPPNFYNN